MIITPGTVIKINKKPYVVLKSINSHYKLIEVWNPSNQIEIFLYNKVYRLWLLYSGMTFEQIKKFYKSIVKISI